MKQQDAGRIAPDFLRLRAARLVWRNGRLRGWPDKVVLALVDQNDSPAALGISGNPPFQDNDGGSGHRGSGRIIGQGDHDGPNGGGGSSADNNPGPTTISSIVTDTGPGGGGSSGYNTN